MSSVFVRRACLCALIGIGCAADEPTNEGLHDGLNLFESDPARGLAGAYVRDGHTIYFETRRGAPLDASYQTPGTPVKYLIDTRFLDPAGRPFYMQKAADRFLDPTWEEDAALPDVGHHEIDVAMAEHNMDLAIELVDRLATTDSIRRAQEIARLQGWAQIARTVETDVVDRDAHAKIQPSTFEDVGYTHYTHVVQVWKRDVRWEHSCAWMPDAQKCANQYGLKCCQGNDPGTGIFSVICRQDANCGPCTQYEVMKIHSATRAFVKTGGDTVSGSTIELCNHGECPGDAGMVRQCTDSWSGRSSSRTDANQSCGNDYSVTSGGTNDHNCHDDTTVQVRNVKNNATGHTAVCGTDACHLLPPSCNGDYEGAYGYAVRQRP